MPFIDDGDDEAVVGPDKTGSVGTDSTTIAAVGAAGTGSATELGVAFDVAFDT